MITAKEFEELAAWALTIDPNDEDGPAGQGIMNVAVSLSTNEPERSGVIYHKDIRILFLETDIEQLEFSEDVHEFLENISIALVCYGPGGEGTKMVASNWAKERLFVNEVDPDLQLPTILHLGTYVQNYLMGLGDE